MADQVYTRGLSESRMEPAVAPSGDYEIRSVPQGATDFPWKPKPLGDAYGVQATPPGVPDGREITSILPPAPPPGDAVNIPPGSLKFPTPSIDGSHSAFWLPKAGSSGGASGLAAAGVMSSILGKPAIGVRGSAALGGGQRASIAQQRRRVAPTAAPRTQQPARMTQINLGMKRPQRQKPSGLQLRGRKIF